MSNVARSKGVKLKPRPVEEVQEEVEDVKTVVPLGRIYESVVADLGFDPMKEMAARRT